MGHIIVDRVHLVFYLLKELVLGQGVLCFLSPRVIVLGRPSASILIRLRTFGIILALSKIVSSKRGKSLL